MKITVSKHISRAQRVSSYFPAATEGGLNAAGNIIRNEVLRRLRPNGKGYMYKTSIGNVGRIGKRGGRHVWYTGATMQHVTLSRVQWSAGRAMISVGTDLLYNLYWELGHHNIFTKHWERDEKWAPAFRDARETATRSFMRTFHALIIEEAQ